MSDFDKIIAGLNIFRRFLKENELYVAAEHDVIYAGPNPDVVPDDVKAELESLRWHPNEEFECFQLFT